MQNSQKSDHINILREINRKIRWGFPAAGDKTRTAAAHGVTLTGHARQVRPEDFNAFDYIVAMDRDNLAALEDYRSRVGGDAALYLLREFDPEGAPGAEVPDPYYGGPSGFEDVFTMVERSCRGLLDHVLQEEGEER